MCNNLTTLSRVSYRLLQAKTIQENSDAGYQEKLNRDNTVKLYHLSD
ncbi:MAG TPA: hypothetical protein VIE89_30670 [Candidatus Binatia bacterium]|jgi:hypothetical protein